MFEIVLINTFGQELPVPAEKYSRNKRAVQPTGEIQMKNKMKLFTVLFVAIAFSFSAPAFAKNDDASALLGKAKKEAANAQGQAKKAEEQAKRDAKKAAKEAEKKQKDAEKEAKKKQKEAEKAAKEAEKKAKEAAETAKS